MCMCLGIAFGSAFGAVFGVLMGNLSIGIAVGTGLGTGLGIVAGGVLDAAKAKGSKPRSPLQGDEPAPRERDMVCYVEDFERLDR